MTTRPTTHWRNEFEEQSRQIAAGELEEGKAYALSLWPIAMTDATDRQMAAFEAELARLGAQPADEAVFAVVKDFVLALNAVDDEYDGPYETDERESLCAYIDAALEDVGIDVAAITARHGIDPHEIAGEWRDW